MKRPVAFLILTSLPSLVHPEQVGRLMYFRGPKALTQFAPIALSSSLTCSPRFDPVMRSCRLQLTNNVSPEDLAQMSAFQGDDSRLQFTPLSGDQIQEVHENFQKMDRDVDTHGVSLPGTLALSEGPYLSIPINKSSRTVDRLMAAYAKDGIGTFSAEFSFDAEHTEDYLELVDTAPLLETFDRFQGGVKPGELEPALVQAVRDGNLASNNLTEAEAIGIAYRTIVANFFRLTREPMFYLNPDAPSNLESPLVLVDETRSPVRAKCAAQLILKKGAQATISCQEAPQ